MRILISNDDGIEARGLRTLSEGLADCGDVLIVAPDRDRSGASNSLTLDVPLRVKRVADNAWRVAGTPTDCVHLALTGLLDKDPDIVVSGINHGANMGDDVIYSGTVAAAMEGRSLGHPAIAVSLVLGESRGHHFASAARAAAMILRRLKNEPLPADTVLNVNVPDLAWENIQGFEVTRLGNRHRAEAMVEQADPRGRPVYWIGPPGKEEDAGPGTDFHAVRRGCVSITPIHADLTRYRALENLAGWVEGFDRLQGGAEQ
jgi:5'-nucleotidase